MRSNSLAAGALDRAPNAESVSASCAKRVVNREGTLSSCARCPTGFAELRSTRNREPALIENAPAVNDCADRSGVGACRQKVLTYFPQSHLAKVAHRCGVEGPPESLPQGPDAHMNVVCQHGRRPASIGIGLEEFNGFAHGAWWSDPSVV